MPDNCQVQTPNKYVEEMLDYVGYCHDLYGKSVLENSCGEGNILIGIVRRYINDARSKGILDNDIIKGLEHDIFAFEKDVKCIEKCKNKLDELIYEKKLSKVNWNIKEQDYLKSGIKLYDYIIGNPPYITYHDLNENERLWLQDNFKSCNKGRYDYYYAFVEKSICSLKPSGRMAYLVPFSIFRNKYAKDLRDIIESDLQCIYDYTGIKIFPRVITSSTIIVCDKQNNNEIFYYQIKENKKISVLKSNLKEKWFFVQKSDKNNRFGDYFSVNNSVATLLNDAFVIKDYHEDERYTYVGQFKIENELLLEAVSTRTIKKNKSDNKKDKIIFPYRLTSTGYKRYNEEEFRGEYPWAYIYLNSFISRLNERKSGKSNNWYEYGRTQAIGEILGEKLILPMVITQCVKVYKAGKRSVPYAGYFVKRKKNSPYSLDDAKRILESADFYEYVKEHGTPTTSTSYRISVNEISDYMF